MKETIISIIIFSVILAGGAFVAFRSQNVKTPEANVAQNLEQNKNMAYDIQGMKVEVLTPGAGADAKAGDTVSVNYVGTLEDGAKFDSSYDRGEPFSFPLGKGEVIKGWDLGVAGMKVGEKRKLTIPSDLGYGDQGAGPIPAKATLIFEVELLGIK